MVKLELIWCAKLLANEIHNTLLMARKLLINPLEVADNPGSSPVSAWATHCITFVDVTTVPLEIIGPQFEHNQLFPADNTEFIQVAT